MSGTVFVNYRRADSSGSAGRLHADLSRLLGPDRVFRDVLIGPGERFRERIDRMLDRCDVLIAVIGPRWSSITGDDGRRRLDDPMDLVRRELARGLERPDVHVIPVLVDGAKLPPRSELPPDLMGLRDRNAFEISDARWDYDVGVIHEWLLEDFGEERRGSQTESIGRAARAMTVAAGATALVAAFLTDPLKGMRDNVDFDKRLPFDERLPLAAERLGLYAVERGILWAAVVALALAAAAVALRGAVAQGDIAGRVIVGLTAGALAGAVGAGMYIALNDLPGRAGPPNPVPQALHLAVTGLIVAGSFARLVPRARAVDCRLAAIAGGVLAAVLIDALFDDPAGLERALAFALQAVLVVGAIGIVLAAATPETADASGRSSFRARPRWVR